MSLSEYFGISVNELLAGKKFSAESIREMADENIVSVFEESEKNRKKQKLQIAVYTSVLIVILLPVLVIAGKELLALMLTQIRTENMISAAISVVVSIALLIIGFLIRKGNVSILHSYHYKNVTDINAYVKDMGNAVMLMCIPLFVNGFMCLFSHIKTVSVISTVLFFAGIILCFIHIFKVQIKHNGSLF